MNFQSTTAKSSKCSDTLNRIKSSFNNIISPNKAKINKIYVENSSQTTARIERTPSKHNVKKALYDFNARPICVNIRGYDTFLANKSKATKSHAIIWEQHHQKVCAIYTSDLYECFDDKYHYNYDLMFKGKPLTRRTIPLIEYNIKNGDTLEYREYGVIGGAKYDDNIILKSFIMFLCTFYPFIYSKSKIYSNDYFSTQWDYPTFKINKLIWKNPKKSKLRRPKSVRSLIDQNLIKKYLNTSKSQWILDLIEDLVFLLQDIYVAIKSSSPKQNVSISVLRFLKLRTKNSLIIMIFENQFSPIIDKMCFLEDQSFQDKIDSFKDLLSQFETIKESKIIANIKQIMNFAIAFSFFEKLGVPLSYTGFNVFEQEMLKKKIKKKGAPDFIHSILTSLVYLTEKGYQFYKSGNASAIFHSGREYTRLYDSICKLRTQSKFLSNPEAHDFTESKYRADLDDTIEELTSIIKYNDTLAKFELNKLKENLNELRMLRFELTTIKASREHRNAPFSVLLYGDSGIGKTTLKDILFYSYASVFNLEKDKTFCYTRNPVAKYWDGFVTSCWCVILDDIAFKHPNLGEDESCMEFLQINNSVPFVPDQAALDRKGTTPLKAKLVIGTTNSKNLNAHFYFSCASAAQRRFPYIITPTVKDKYADVNGMLASEKCDQIEGRYPDYWNFKVEKVRSLAATPQNLGRPASFELVKNFTNIDDFISWYGKAALAFDENQKIVKDSVNMISNIDICKKCCRNSIACDCLKDQSSIVVYTTKFFLGQFIYSIVNWVLVNIYYYLAFYLIGGFPGICSYITSKFSPELFNKHIYQIYKQTGVRMQKSLGKYNQLIQYGVILSSVIVSYKTMSWVWGKYFSVEKSPEQGNSVGKVPEPLLNERDNTWYRPDIELSTFNLSPEITSSKSLTKDEIINKLQKNCHYMIVKNKRLDYTHAFRTINISGNQFLINDHSHREFLFDDECFLISGANYGTSRNISFCLSENDTRRNKSQDLCMLTINQVNPGPDIRGLLPKCSNLVRQNGFYIKREESSKISTIDLFNSESVRYLGSDFNTDAYRLKTNSPTREGDCGSMLILSTPMGFVFAGLHVGGKEEIVASTRLDLNLINALMPQICFQQGNPVLSAPSQSVVLGELHPKSVFAYIEKGTAEVIGSYKGFRRKPKSKVENTPLNDLLSKRGYSTKYTKPLMNGYIPFRIAALDMVNPVTQFNTDVLKLCTNSYFNDIIEDLDINQIKDIVHPYTMDVAVNGAPGVSYVDRLKVSTSAGNPWKCKKTKFLTHKVDGINYDLDKEIIDRVNNIMGTYVKNTRAHPIFCAHLKDEPVTFKKADIGKTRVFTGAPMDWSIVNRMYYLSLIRLIQNNKLAFETGVGTIAQSVEWSNLLKYLLREKGSIKNYDDHLMLNRFIAGDYKSFDKRMSPSFILAAFDILIRICKISGNYSIEEEKILWGIAYDTAYPTVDFNGDLVQFYGSNPSGHPLTVIINSLVNSLYIRYAYYIVNPKHELQSFKRNVRLLTYGDDNVMTSNVNWFNHTAISNSLSIMGVTYTMADKEAKSVPFIHLSQVSFLKRQWVWNIELGAYLAPLEHDSIEKMLMTWTRSNICEEAQMLDIVESACSEYFFYGKKIFIEKIKLLRSVIQDKKWEHFIVPSTFPSWGLMKERFLNCSHRAGFTDYSLQFEVLEEEEYADIDWN